jgi:hypothetical protein
MDERTAGQERIAENRLEARFRISSQLLRQRRILGLRTSAQQHGSHEHDEPIRAYPPFATHVNTSTTQGAKASENGAVRHLCPHHIATRKAESLDPEARCSYAGD